MELLIGSHVQTFGFQQILDDDDCACFLVEAIAKKSQNIKWSTMVDKKKVQHKLIRRVSMDQFYWILTGDRNAFYKVCMKLPEVINSVINEESGVTVPNDTVIEELRRLSLLYEEQPEDLAMAMAVYMLGFSTYMGFANRIEQKLDCGDEKKIKRIYEYVKKVR